MPESVIELLRREHRDLEDQLGRLERTDDVDQQARIVEEVQDRVRHLSKVEEEVLYPALRNTADSERVNLLAAEGEVVHRMLDNLLEELGRSGKGSLEFRARSKALRELLEHHVRVDQHELLEIGERQLPIEELETLGAEMERREQTTGPGPGGPGGIADGGPGGPGSAS